MSSIFIRAALLFAYVSALNGFAGFSAEQLKMLKSPSGWDYFKMTDTGMRTEHPCFAGKPPTDECSGRLVLGIDNRFVQEVVIHGQAVQRHGTYTLRGDQLTFVDELETKDGPYTVSLDSQSTALVLAMPQVRIELTPHKVAPAPEKKLKALGGEQVTLLKDPQGWDYIRITDNGLVIEHPCFDGKPHQDGCSARLRLSADNSFVQNVVLESDMVARHGTYTLEDNQLTFLDELGTRDGPYTVEVDLITNSLVLSAPQVRIELTLHKAPQNKKRKESK